MEPVGDLGEGLRSYISAVIKNRLGILQAIRDAITGNPSLPPLPTTTCAMKERGLAPGGPRRMLGVLTSNMTKEAPCGGRVRGSAGGRY